MSDARRWALVVAALVLAPFAILAPMSDDRANGLAFVALVPWAVVVLAAPRAGPLLGFLAMIVGYAPLMREVASYSSWFAPAAGLCFGFALVGTGYSLRAAAGRTRVPLTLLLAPLWTAGELMRTNAVIPPGFRLATALHRQLWALQVCDLAGMSALSFALALTSAAVAAAILGALHPAYRPRAPALRVEVAIALGAWACVALYGGYRLREARSTVRAGPRVLIVGSDILSGTNDQARRSALAAVTRDALREGPRPDLIAWPESVAEADIDPAFIAASPTLALAAATLPPLALTGSEAGDLGALLRRQAIGRVTRRWIARQAQDFGAPTVLGVITIAADGARWRRYNSAVFVAPDADAPMRRHDKIDLFPVYEAVPYRDAAAAPLRWLHDALEVERGRHPQWPVANDPGTHAEVFSVAGEAFAAPICFETDHERFELRPELRGPGRPRFWVNIANDTWSRRTNTTLHAFRFNVFRAVEARVGIARAANAGVSGFVSPTGEVYDVIGGPDASAMPARVAPGAPRENVVARSGRVRIDRRETLYVATRGATDDALLGLWWGALGWALWRAQASKFPLASPRGRT